MFTYWKCWGRAKRHCHKYQLLLAHVESCLLFPLLQLWLPKPPRTTLYIQHVSTLCHCSIHLNQFSHPEDGGSMFLWNVRTFNHNTLRKRKRQLSFGQHLLWKPDSFCNQIPSLCNDLFWLTCVVEQKCYSILFRSVWNCRISSLNLLFLCTFWEQLIIVL